MLLFSNQTARHTHTKSLMDIDRTASVNKWNWLSILSLIKQDVIMQSVVIKNVSKEKTPNAAMTLISYRHLLI